ncbi:cell division protein SepF [Amnibacterium soli]|jgi:cell division inhibitor SepF|uniref:Cell division protein SepF n=1 Tax=Amnibacterium soli TaxID=1282736 RepID=A0ABP8YYT4_9MICO
MSNPIRKSMVWLGLADDQYEYAEPVEPVSPHVQPVVTRAQVTPLPRRVASVPRVAVPEMNEILTVHPRQYRDAQQIAEHFREGTPVIINLTQMTEAEARRLVDFASGLSTGLRGRIERVTSKVFLLSPEHITVSGEEPGAESDLDATFTG